MVTNPTNLNGDLSVLPQSIISARVITAREILGSEVSTKEDEQLLDIINNIHLEAKKEDSSQEAKDLSALLFNQESIIWAKNNGYNSLLEASNQERRINAYKQSWSFTLNPPMLPNFKSRDQLAKEEVDRRYPSGNYELDNLRPTSGLLPRPTPTKEQVINRYKSDPNVIHRYYDQFSNYINQNLGRFVDLKVSDTLSQVKWGDRDKSFQALWKISNIQEMIPKADYIRVRGAPPLPPLRGNPLFSGNAYFFKSHNGQFGIIKPNGSLLFFPSNIPESILLPDNKPSTTAVLIGLGIKPSKDAKFIEVDKSSISVSNSGSNNTIRKVVRHNTHSYFLNQINQWKEANYNPSSLETFFKTIIPFYETIHNELYDDSYTFEFKDIAFDTADLVFTIATIGFSAIGGYKGIAAAIKVAKAGQSTSRLARTTTALRGILATVKKGSFLRTAGKELTDFVVPVFTARDVSRSLARASVTGTSNIATKLRSAVRSSDEAASLAASSSQFFQKASDEEILNRLYTNIYELKEGTVSRNITVPLIQQKIDTKASQKIPDTVFRGQIYDPTVSGLPRSHGAVDPSDKDAYLASIIQHTAKSRGSAGKVLSLSSDKFVAKRFASRRPNGRVFKIDTTKQPDQFRTVEDIIKVDGPRLVREGKIKPATLSKAIVQSLNENESEIFYLGGDIPADIIKMTSRQPTDKITTEPLLQASNEQLIQSMASFSNEASGTIVDSSRRRSNSFDSALVTITK
ncbi:hypothetical protein [Spartinivicinus poritis]|uniref:Uncharacterized protein n=1 Tax=Spartinivicinus poritis TaxID=2994640 RepID=A0ABT5UGH4_9GAMM|nr:hypothetical protein [Spartinivicinus sp. A2-2]MDE1465490.1 hypothetical protein [Spartinivicinus sp. A2-2]